MEHALTGLCELCSRCASTLSKKESLAWLLESLNPRHVILVLTRRERRSVTEALCGVLPRCTSYGIAMEFASALLQPTLERLAHNVATHFGGGGGGDGGAGGTSPLAAPAPLTTTPSSTPSSSTQLSDDLEFDSVGESFLSPPMFFSFFWLCWVHILLFFALFSFPFAAHTVLGHDLKLLQVGDRRFERTVERDHRKT